MTSDSPQPPSAVQRTTADALRRSWMDFFVARGHHPVSSASLVPENDPTLLFTGAGMNQFKEQFLGKGDLTHRRACSVQKCFRQGDLENVGRTPRHLTFFEMLGHFSFGDYFKQEAIAWAWEFLLKELCLPQERLRVTVYKEDEEAYRTWLALGVKREWIGRFDARENFWPADAPSQGPNGPCGPCSEIFFDYGESAALGDGSANNFDSGRYVEIWNTVFTQFDRREGGELVPLPQRNIDCGAGFERLVAAAEGQQSPFSSSLFKPLVEAVADLAGVAYRFDAGGAQVPGEGPRRVRRIAEHARASCFLIADGVRPSNEGRGYVLRRVLRRAIRDGIQLGLEKPFLAALVDPVIALMGNAHPVLREGRTTLRGLLEGEEQRFRETYATGLRYLEEEVQRLGSARVLPGAVAFRLHDTYGFPLDLAQVILGEREIVVDVPGFEAEMEAQRERARRGSKIKGEIFAGGPLSELRERGVARTEFLGYEGAGVVGAATIVGLVRGDVLTDRAAAGDEVTIVLDRTPFYAESGGQVGDSGEIEAPAGQAQVGDTQRTEGYSLHVARVQRGTLSVGDRVQARVDVARRDAIRRNHTATHLLHLALKQVLGEHVRQEGSLVAHDRLRFDFRHEQALSAKELAEIEGRVNDWILRNDPVQTDVMDLEAAKASGAVSLFGEKYDAEVRVLSLASGSRELCGGTHCRRSGDIGSFRITLETSIAAGVRRMEAVTGLGAMQLAARDRGILGDLGGRLKAQPDELVARVESLQEEIRTLRKAQEKAAREAGSQAAASLGERSRVQGGVRVLVEELRGLDAKALKGVADSLGGQKVDVVVLVGEQDGKAPLLVRASAAAQAKGVDARALLQALTSAVGGGGGGSAGQAQGQGQERSGIAAALKAAQEVLHAALGTPAS